MAKDRFNLAALWRKDNARQCFAYIDLSLSFVPTFPVFAARSRRKRGDKCTAPSLIQKKKNNETDETKYAELFFFFFFFADFHFREIDLRKRFEKEKSKSRSRCEIFGGHKAR